MTAAAIWKYFPNIFNKFSIFYSSPEVEEDFNNSEDAMLKDYKMKLLTGELEAARASNISLYVAQTNKGIKSENTRRNGDKVGILILTNFRLAFITLDKTEDETVNVSYQENTFLGKYDISLSNIDKIYQITDRKKKLVGPQHKNSNKIESIKILCKNFRVLTFCFKSSEMGKGKYIADALVKFAFPTRHNLLFLYNFKEKYYNTSRYIRMFNQKSDWTQELERCGAKVGWRVLSVDRIEDNSLPYHYVVPKELTDYDYFNLARSFRNCRTAIWVWSLNNAALIRMADLLPDVAMNASNTPENIMLEHVRKCNPQRKPPKIYELTRMLPSIQDVNTSYLKLRELCAPENDRQFMLQDARFYSLLDKSYWLLYVSLCLKYSTEISILMKNDGETIVLQETNGRDMCCVISSLVQLLLDPHWRTLTGFQTLIQKEWISLGHPFSDRLGHVINNSTTEQSPLFLLFLECVWQLLQQFPAEFEFSETFLTTIWDSVFLPIFDTFQFNSEYDRQIAVNNDRLILRPVWDWGEQFSDKDIALFSNPLYKKQPTAENEIEINRKSKIPTGAYRLPAIDDLKLQNNSRNSVNVSKLNKIQLNTNSTTVPTNNNHIQDRYLEPKHSICHLEIWEQCYFRWMPFLEIKNGGTPQIDLFNRLVVNNIHKLQKALETGNFSELQQSNGDLTKETAKEKGAQQLQLISNNLPEINSFFPFSSNISNSAELTDMLILNGELLTEGSIFDASSYQFD